MGLRWPLFLLVVVFTDVTLFRLALPLLEPAANGLLGDSVPEWFHWAQKGSVFFFYTSTFICGVCLWNIRLNYLARIDHHWRFLRQFTNVLTLCLLLGAFLFLFAKFNDGFALGMEGLALLVCTATWVYAMKRKGLLSRFTIAGFFLLIPYVVHFFGFLFFALLQEENGFWNGTIESIRLWTQIFIGLSLLVVTVCFLERPLLSEVTRILPFVIAMVVSLTARIFIQHGYAHFSETFERGFGIVLSTSPGWKLQLVYVLLVTLFAWNISMRFFSEKHNQNQLGIGLSLIVFGGFSFSWPMQYLSCLAGFMMIASSEHEFDWMVALDKEMSG